MVACLLSRHIGHSTTEGWHQCCAQGKREEGLCQFVRAAKHKAPGSPAPCQHETGRKLRPARGRTAPGSLWSWLAAEQPGARCPRCRGSWPAAAGLRRHCAASCTCDSSQPSCDTMQPAMRARALGNVMIRAGCLISVACRSWRLEPADLSHDWVDTQFSTSANPCRGHTTSPLHHGRACVALPWLLQVRLLPPE